MKLPHRLRRLYLHYAVRPQGSYVISYPKSGRTWLRLLLAGVLSELTDRPLSLRLWQYGDRRRGIPYILFSHDGADRPDRRPEFSDKTEFAGKPVLLVVRDPKDVIVSHFFHLTRRARQFDGDLDAFIRSPVFGIDRMIDFLNRWASPGPASAFGVVRYEQLAADTRSTLAQAVEFFRIPSVTDDHLRRAVDQASFERMRRFESAGTLEDSRLRPADPHDPESFKTRRGRVGGYVDYLTGEQIAVIERRVRQRLAPVYASYL